MNHKIQKQVISILGDFRKLLYKKLSPLEIEYENNWYSPNLITRYSIILDIISNFIDKRREAAFLDIGVVYGHFSYLLRHFFNCRVSGVDVKNPYFEKIEEILKKEIIDLKSADLNKDPVPFENNCFNFVIFAEVIEHLSVHPGSVLKEVIRVLNEDGCLLLTTPNFSSLENRIKMFFGKNILAMYEKNECNYWRHWRIYTMDECITLLKENNFDIILQSYFNLEKPKLCFFSFLYNLITNFAIPLKDNLIILAKKK